MLKNSVRGKGLRLAGGFAVAALIVGVPAHATVLYGNLGNAAFAGTSVDSTPVDQGFRTDNNNYSLNSVTVGLYNDGSLGSVTAYVYSDVAGAPGASLANLGTILDTVIDCCGIVNDITFTAPLNVSLAANTTYFFVLQGTTPGTAGHDALWADANDNSGTGVAGEPGSNGTVQPLVMSVQATATTPEPRAGLLLLTGLGALLAMKGRKMLAPVLRS
jgi:hypothetical protein